MSTLAAQPVDRLQPGQAQIVRLSGSGMTLFTYESPGNEVVTITVRGIEPLEADETEIVRDTVVEVINPAGKSIAYSDDQLDRPDLLPTDAVIPKLELVDTGIYTVRVDTYGGIFASEVEVLLEQVDLYETTTIEEEGITLITGWLPPQRAYTYPLELCAPATLTITAQSVPLDPRLELTDSQGQVIAANDDHNSPDPALDVLDSRLQVDLPAGDYTLRLADFLGRAGRFALSLDPTPPLC